MLGLRAKAKKLRGRLDNEHEFTNGIDAGLSENAALLAHLIYRRELAGSTTTMRQVHHLADIKQPEALRIIREFENRGLMLVEQDISDALESKITLSEAMRQRLDKIMQSDPS